MFQYISLSVVTQHYPFLLLSNGSCRVLLEIRGSIAEIAVVLRSDALYRGFNQAMDWLQTLTPAAPLKASHQCPRGDRALVGRRWGGYSSALRRDIEASLTSTSNSRSIPLPVML